MRVRRAALVSAAVALVAAAPAQGKSATVDGHVVAPPVTAGKRVSVPLLLTERAERRLRLGVAVVRINLPRRTALPGPSASIRPDTLRAGDRVRGQARLSARALKRMRRASVPRLALARARVLTRASKLSNDELQRMLESLGERLLALSARVDGLAASTFGQLAALGAGLAALDQRSAAFASSLDSLQAAVAGLATRVQSLEQGAGAGSDAAMLATMRSDLDDVLGRVGLLEGDAGGLGTDLAALTSTVSGLAGTLGTTQTQLTGLLGVTQALGDRMDLTDEVLADVPGIITQVSAIDGALSTLGGRVTTAEGLLANVDGTVGGLTTTVTGLTAQTSALASTVGEHATDLAGLTTSVGSLETDVSQVSSVLTSLQGTVGGLTTTTNGLVSDVGALATQTASLQVVADLVCAVPLLIKCP